MPEFITKDFDEIMTDMLAKIDDKYDKRQGSVIYNLLAPAASELAIQYVALEEMVNTQFLDTSYGDFLTRLASQFGVQRLPATRSTRRAYFNETIPIGTRFSVLNSEINFVVTDQIDTNLYYLTSETAGSQANHVQGELINIDVIDEFSGAVIGEVVIPGEDEELDSDLRERTINYINTPTLNGNVAQYEVWASQFEGVGSVSIEPLWAGENTIKLSITDSDGNQASPELIRRLQDYIDPEPKGHGLGVAPVGAYVTVESVAGTAITITATIKLAEYADIESVHLEAELQLQSYLRLEAFAEKEVKTYKVATLLDRVSGIEGVDNVLINGQSANVQLVGASMPTLESVVLNV